MIKRTIIGLLLATAALLASGCTTDAQKVSENLSTEWDSWMRAAAAAGIVGA